ncbi:hypothetical protein BDF20DRAFT_916947 [Mycotypha africana]|uniref:uncharacterized protein n=1 Tax=Mycotypha africana TaxID=64632 RepID=UPI0023002558|nr:uncharacterized protein BDF20DRAFT_916947 [Mycotypha africana]KAI8968420.1 hypothetical protein BDF20DRAFT_916947 [Mycotypha africana]
MDPGYKLLQHIKTVPNLINEDPSITTPKNSSFMDLPWSEFSKLLATNDNKHRVSTASSTDTNISSKSTTANSSSTDLSSLQNIEEESIQLGNWDSMTGYQDVYHTISRTSSP